MLEYQKYNTALRIEEDADLFSYGMRTNVGNTFAYGELKAVDKVSFDIYKGEWKLDYPNGHGTLKHRNGDLYEGQFKSGKIHGNGIVHYADGSKPGAPADHRYA